MALQSPKSCFGKSWDGGNVLCKGGLDPAYVHPETGSNQRDPCGWYNPCAARTNATRMSNQPQQAPHQQQIAQPTSPWTPVKQIVNRLTQIPPMPQAPQQAPIQHQQQVYQQQQQQQMAHPAMAMVPYMVPMNYQWPGSQMPGYLTIPEPVITGQHWMTRLFFNVARSMAKSSGHTVANFFDHQTINPWQTTASKE